jgi:hypothetical protein
MWIVEEDSKVVGFVADADWPEWQKWMKPRRISQTKEWYKMPHSLAMQWAKRLLNGERDAGNRLALQAEYSNSLRLFISPRRNQNRAKAQGVASQKTEATGTDGG